jgi:hypothetical protein
MILRPGTKIAVDGQLGYFQQFIASSNGTMAVILLESGKFDAYTLNSISVETDNADNIIREFVEYAVENKVAPTDLVNLALKELQ